MLKENTIKPPSIHQNIELLVGVYKNKLRQCGVSKRDVERLASQCSIDELKKIVIHHKNQVVRMPANSSYSEKEEHKNLRTLQTSTQHHCRVRSFKPSKKHRHLCCSRKRKKVDRALTFGGSTRNNYDPLKHLGYLDDSMKASQLEGIIERCLNPSHGLKNNNETH